MIEVSNRIGYFYLAKFEFDLNKTFLYSYNVINQLKTVILMHCFNFFYAKVFLWLSGRALR